MQEGFRDAGKQHKMSPPSPAFVDTGTALDGTALVTKYNLNLFEAPAK